MGSDAGASDFGGQDGSGWTEANDDTLAKTMPALKNNQHVIADFDTGHLELINDIEVRSSPTLGSLEEATTDASVTMSPRARMREHAYKYLADFTIQLNMTRAHDLGMSLGLKLEFDTDYQPAAVLRIQKIGLVQEWNEANPGKDLHIGDEIVQVNNVKWHHNTPTFLQRVIGQFKAGRNEIDGASEMLTLYVQRPRPEGTGKRYALQRVDAHAKAFPVEFDAEIPFGLVPVARMNGSTSESMNSVMGFELNCSIDYNPVSIANIKKDGILAAYNTLHPDRIILEGDEIVRVGDVLWHHSAQAFDHRMRAKFDHFRHGEIKTLGLAIRRPRSVHEAWLAAHPDYARPHGDEVASQPAGEAGAAEDDDEPVIGGYEDDDQDQREPKPGQRQDEKQLEKLLGERNKRKESARKHLEHSIAVLSKVPNVAPARKKMQQRLDYMIKKQLEDSISALPLIPEVAEAQNALQLQLTDVIVRILSRHEA